nr:RNA-directed DNA polymerase, eukaryota [Tanacetum cinerariifolium]
MGKWLPNDINYLIISVYAPQELSEKKMLWQYLVHVICGWNGDVIIMSDFNEVCIEAERFGSTFNARGAAAFNSFISTCGLVELAKKLKNLKEKIRSWVKDKKEKAHVLKNSLKKKLADIDSVLDKGEATSDMLEDRLDAMNSLTKLEKMESIELAQKAKIKWSIEGDENSKYLH